MSLEELDKHFRKCSSDTETSSAPPRTSTSTAPTTVASTATPTAPAETSAALKTLNKFKNTFLMYNDVSKGNHKTRYLLDYFAFSKVVVKASK